jgi:hypothetical protein
MFGYYGYYYLAGYGTADEGVEENATAGAGVSVVRQWESGAQEDGGRDL